MKSKYPFDLRPASIEEAGLFYSNDEQDEALGTVGHLRLDFGHGFLPLRSTCYPHNDDQFDTLEFKMLLREFLEAMQENGPAGKSILYGSLLSETRWGYHRGWADLRVYLGNRALSFLPSMHAQSV